MKAIQTLSRIFFFVLLFCTVTVFGQTQTANYTITFEGTWSPITHPTTNFPSNAHWSNLVGATHNSNVMFVGAGLFASAGIESVAESGINDTFNQEVLNAITAGNANLYLEQVFDAFSPTSSASKSITVDKDFPLLSLASMIAPSPDWMIQVNSLSLLDTNGDWLPSITMDLFPYDAGTENGDTYSFDNTETIPQEPITSLQNIAPFSNVKVGTLTVSLVSLSVEDFTAKNPIAISTNAATKSIQVYNYNRKNIQKMDVYDAFGNIVKRYTTSTNSSEYSISLTAVKNGLYVVKLQTENGIITKKILL
ncbi:spondin domain-containing protein [uncultured Kordia sp.]|uniref:spondin domain-containing protein n=1 Tax=uncultured Kordia sp. TaxID=507699 RepID=UPI00262C7DF0|nr:spondin domain-containing protein [uncultured Kordia sp.]